MFLLMRLTDVALLRRDSKSKQRDNQGLPMEEGAALMGQCRVGKSSEHPAPSHLAPMQPKTQVEAEL